MKAFVRPQVAVDYLWDVGFSIGKDTLQAGLQQRDFPFGDYIKAPAPGGQDVYLIYGLQKAGAFQSREESY